MKSKQVLLWSRGKKKNQNIEKTGKKITEKTEP
jgi:hypothetical protein